MMMLSFFMFGVVRFAAVPVAVTVLTVLIHILIILNSRETTPSYATQ